MTVTIPLPTFTHTKTGHAGHCDRCPFGTKRHPYRLLAELEMSRHYADQHRGSHVRSGEVPTAWREYAYVPPAHTCAICANPFDAARADARYCSNACSMRAYRRRKAEQRITDAAQRRKTEEDEHRETWVRFLIDHATQSRKQAERTYVALRSIGRLDGEPWEQTALSV